MPTINKTDLINDVRTILVGKVGIYGFPDNSATPAIALLPDREYAYNYPPTNVTRTGVECVVVEPDPEVTLRHSASAAFNSRFRFYLKQWDTTIDLVDTSETLVFGLSQRGYQIDNWATTLASEELGVLRTITFDVLDSYLVFAS